MNSYAISTSDLADSLTRSSASLVAANNTLEQSVALTTAANTTIQNPEVVGTTLKTLAMRIRGVKTELEEAGEDTEGMITNTSKLQAKVQALTNVDGKGGVNILANSGEFKSTYDILLEISKVWGKMNDMDQAALLEIIAGKRAGSAVASILQNGDILESVYKDALGADGSAQQELSTYLDSIQGKLDQLSNSTQTMWMNFMESDTIKFFIDLATAIVKATDKIGLLKIAVAAFFAKTAFKGDSFGQIFKLDIDEDTGKIKNFGINLSGAAKNAQGLGIATKAAAIGTQLLNAAMSAFISMAISAVIGLIVKGLDNLIHAEEKAAQAAEEALNAYEQTQKTLRDQKATIDDLAESYSKLSKGVDLDTNENISLATSSYREYLDVCNDIADMYPELVTGFDAEGNAILSLKGNVDELIKAYEEAAQASRQKMIASGDDVFNTFKTTYSDDPDWTFDSTGLTQQLKLAEKLQDLINNGTQKEIDDFFENLNAGNIEIDGDKYSNIELEDLIESAGLNDDFWLNSFGLRRENIDIEAFKQQSSKLLSFMKSTTAKINAETNKVKTLMDAYLGEDLQYATLDEDTRKLVDSIISNLNAEFINGFENADELWVWIKTNIVDKFADPKLGQQISEKISGAFDLQSAFQSGDINLDDYSNQIDDFAEYIRNLDIDDSVKKQILKMFGFEGIGSVIDKQTKDMRNYALSLIGETWENIAKIEQLTFSDLQVINSEAFKVEPGVILTWDQLQQKIKETRIATTEDFTADSFLDYADGINAVSTNISTLQEALEKLESGQFTITDYVELIEQFPDLAKGVDISSKKFKGLASNLKRAIRNSPEDLIEDLEILREQLVEAGKSTEYIDQLIVSINNMPEDAVDGVIDKYSTLTEEINAAKIATNELKEAMQENPNEGYETRGEAIEKMKTLMEEGKIGSESELWSIAEEFGFTYDSAKTINENADALHEFITTREKWYKTDKDGNYQFEGIESFIKYVAGKKDVLEKFGATWTYKDGVFDFDLDNEQWEEFAAALGLTSEEFSDLMIQIGQFYGIKWGDPDDALAYITKMTEGIEDPKKKLEEYGKLMEQYFGDGSTIDLSNRPTVDATTMQGAGWTDFNDGYATVYSSSFSNEDGTKTVVLTPILPDGKVLSPEELQSYADKLLAGEELDPGIDIKLAEFEGEDSIEQADQYAENLHKAQEEYYALAEEVADPLNVESTLEESGLDGLSKIKELQDVIKQNSDGTTVVDEEAFRTILQDAGYAAEDIDALIKKIKEYQQLEKQQNTDPLGIKETGATVESVSAALDELDILYSRLRETPGGEVLGLSINAKDLITTLKEKGWTKEKIDEYLQTLQSEDNGVEIEFDITQPEIDAALEEAFAEGGGTPPEVSTDYNLTGTGKEDVKTIETAWEGITADKETKYTVTTEQSTTNEDPTTQQSSKTEVIIEAEPVVEITETDPEVRHTNVITTPITLNKDDPVDGIIIINPVLETPDGEPFVGYDGYVPPVKEEHRSNPQVWDWRNTDTSSVQWGDAGEPLEFETAEPVTVQAPVVFETMQESDNPIVLPDLEPVEQEEPVTVATPIQVEPILNNNGLTWFEATEFVNQEEPVTVQTPVVVEPEIEEGTSETLAMTWNEFLNFKQEEPVTIEPVIDVTNSSEYSDAIFWLNLLADSLQNYNRVIGQGGDGSGYLTSIEYIVSSLSEGDGAGFINMAQLIVDGLNLLSQGVLSAEDASVITSVITNIVNALSTFTQNGVSTTGVGADLATGIATGLTTAGLETTAATVGADITTALQTALSAGSYDYTVTPAIDQEAVNTINAITYDTKTVDIVPNSTTLWTEFTRIANKVMPTKIVTIKYKEEGKPAGVNGTAHVRGTAYKNGSWGAPKDEIALVGELGTELVVRDGRWFTVGENGAEFTDIQRGDIIFNHKQTEDLLSKGYVTGRGKAYAEGTAYVSGGGARPSGKYQFSDTSNSASKKSQSSKTASKSSKELSDDFKEIFDWIEVRLEEITEAIDLTTAKLDNAIGYAKQNNIIDDLIDLNKDLYDNLTAGAAEYYAFAEELLAKVPAQYRDMAKDGSIVIESFTGKVGDQTLDAINDYREWVQKGADATQQAEETLTEISSLAKQAIDNIAADYENKVSLRDSKKDQLDAYNAFLETDVGFESAKIYQAMMKENNKIISTLDEQRDAMQAELNKRVEAGEIKKYSQDWYDAVNDISELDSEIIELKTDIEDWQDVINELHWDKFDLLQTKIETIKDEAENLIDVLSNEDLVDKDTAEWTDAGITSLGLYAQQMEAAEVQAQQYKEEIAYLNKNWKTLGYTEAEYIDRLEELKSGQYDSIKLYYEMKDAIVDLTSERVDAIKEGIEKEIEAYEELIEKKKEELDSEKDLYDFQKGVANQQKEIADIERKLAALSADNSASARAQRAKLQAELAEAQQELQDTYYDRSISDQQDALDKELENFRDEKEKEIEGWEEYLEDTNKVVSDGLALVKDNTHAIYETLQDMGKEYGLSITESLTSPWKEGEYAIQSFSDQFGIAMSATVEELWKVEDEFKNAMLQIEQNSASIVDSVNTSSQTIQAAVKKEPASANDSSSNSGSSSSTPTESNSYPYGKASDTSGDIRQGAKGQNVKAIQYALNQLGYGNSGTKGLDGSFGPNTTDAVKKFQKAMGIKADGIVGSTTRSKFRAKGYAIGTSGVKNNQLALIDELGEELVMHAGKNGKLAFLSKGSAVIPHDISENLMQLGALDPQDVLDRNKPQIAMSPSVVNNTMEISIDASVGELIHVENLNGNNPAEVTKIVDKAWDKYMKELNAHIRRYTNR